MTTLTPLSRHAAAGIAERLAGMAVEALVDEAMLTPKPGLVDMRGSGAHSDLSWLLMCRSANSLRPAFLRMAQAGATIRDAAQQMANHLPGHHDPTSQRFLFLRPVLPDAASPRPASLSSARACCAACRAPDNYTFPAARSMGRLSNIIRRISSRWSGWR